LALFLSVFLCTLEFVLGISLLFNAAIKRTSWVLFPLMIFFTFLTLVDAIWEPVPDCGCFGDAIKLSNWETFYKNVVLIILVAIIFLGRNRFRPPQMLGYGFLVNLVFVVGFVWFSNYNIDHLPVVDFREWKVGNDMAPEGGGEAKIYLIYRNINSGEEKEFISDELPWQDSVWMANHEFVDQRIDDSEVIKVHDLIIESESGDDMTDYFIRNSEYQFILVSWDVEAAERDAFEIARGLYASADNDGHSFIVITSSLPDVVYAFKDEMMIPDEMEFFYGDDTVLKSMIRANPGLILMKEGIVLAKWHYNDFPEYDEIRADYMND
jgi:hypothetical protein